ncbi:hypothetical protein D9M72_558520 [compost metagenome]
MARMPRACGKSRSVFSRRSASTACQSSTRSHLLKAITAARPSRKTRSTICRSCFSKGMVASKTMTTVSAKRIARSASATESFSSFSCTFALRRMPAVSNILMVRPRQSHSTEMESRVMPASGPVKSRSSPRKRLISVDLPAFGRPTIATRNGLVSS